MGDIKERRLKYNTTIWDVWIKKNITSVMDCKQDSKQKFNKVCLRTSKRESNHISGTIEAVRLGCSMFLVKL